MNRLLKTLRSKRSLTRFIACCMAACYLSPVLPAPKNEPAMPKEMAPCVVPVSSLSLHDVKEITATHSTYVYLNQESKDALMVIALLPMRKSVDARTHRALERVLAGRNTILLEDLTQLVKDVSKIFTQNKQAISSNDIDMVTKKLDMMLGQLEQRTIVISEHDVKDLAKTMQAERAPRIDAPPIPAVPVAPAAQVLEGPGAGTGGNPSASEEDFTVRRDLFVCRNACVKGIVFTNEINPIHPDTCTPNEDGVTCFSGNVAIQSGHELRVSSIVPVSVYGCEADTSSSLCFGNLSITNGSRLLVNEINPVNVYDCHVADENGTTNFSGNVDIDKNLTVHGDVNVYGSSTFVGPVCVLNTLSITDGNVLLVNEINPISIVDGCGVADDTGTTFFSGNVVDTKNVTIDGDLNVYGDSTFVGTACFQNTVSILDGNILLVNEINPISIVDGCGVPDDNGTTVFSGNVVIDKNLTVYGDVIINVNNLCTTNATVTNTLLVNEINPTLGCGVPNDAGTTTFSGNVAADQNVSIDGDLTVYGSSVFDGDVTVVPGNTLFVNEIDPVPGDDTTFFSGNIATNDNVTVGGDVTVYGTIFTNEIDPIDGSDTTFFSGNIATDDNVTIGGDLTVYGDVFFNGPLCLNNTVSVLDGNVLLVNEINPISIVGGCGVADDTGTTTFSGNVAIDQNLTVTGDLNVYGNSHFNNLCIDTATVTGTLLVNEINPTSGCGIADDTASTFFSGNVVATQDVTVVGGLNVYGQSVFSNDVTVVPGNTLFVNEIDPVAGNDTTFFSGNIATNDNVTVGGDLTVYGDTFLGGQVTFGGALCVDNTLSVTNGNVLLVNEINPISIVGGCGVADDTGTTTFSGNVAIDGNLSVDGDFNVYGSSTFSNLCIADATVTGILLVNEINPTSGCGIADDTASTFFSGNVVATKDVTVVGGLNVYGQSVFSNDVTVVPGNTLFVNEIDPVSGNDTTFFSGNIATNDNVTIGGDLTVYGTTLLNGPLCLDNTVSILNGNVLLVNEINPISIVGGCGVADDAGTTTFSGNVAIDGDLTVDGSLNVYGDVSFEGNVCVNNATVSGVLLTNEINPTSGCGIANDAGTTTFSGNVAMDQNLSIDGDLNVYGSSVFNGPVTFNGGIVGDICVDGTVAVSNKVLVNQICAFTLDADGNCVENPYGTVNICNLQLVPDLSCFDGQIGIRAGNKLLVNEINPVTIDINGNCVADDTGTTAFSGNVAIYGALVGPVCFEGQVGIADGNRLLVNEINPISPYDCQTADENGTTAFSGNVTVDKTLCIQGNIGTYGLPTGTILSIGAGRAFGQKIVTDGLCTNPYSTTGTTVLTVDLSNLPMGAFVTLTLFGTDGLGQDFTYTATVYVTTFGLTVVGTESTVYANPAAVNQITLTAIAGANPGEINLTCA